MKESEIRKKAIDILEKDGYKVWYPPKVRWRKEGDIWGVFDLIAVNEGIIRFIQLTTLSNIRARERKVLKFLLESNAKIKGEVWGYDKKKRKFKIIQCVA